MEFSTGKAGLFDNSLASISIGCEAGPCAEHDIFSTEHTNCELPGEGQACCAGLQTRTNASRKVERGKCVRSWNLTSQQPATRASRPSGWLGTPNSECRGPIAGALIFANVLAVLDQSCSSA